jgi:ABC-type nitrate/sulfonate/bicarbonate transport system substrate-binding protein
MPFQHSRFAVLVTLLWLTVVGCARRPDAEQHAAEGGAEYETLELRYQGASGAVLYPELAAELGFLAPLKLRWVGNTISGPQDIQTVVTNDVEFGAAFNGSIIKLIQAGAPIQAVLGVYSVDRETWNGFYVLDGSPITSARDFIGKKVGMNTLGAHSEFMLREYLYRGGLSKAEVDEVTLVPLPPVNSEQSLRQKQVDVTTLGGILRDKALERGGIHPVFTDYDLFGSFTSASYVLRTEFIQKNPNSARKFVSATAQALEWARETPRDAVIRRFEAIIRERKRNEDSSALKYCRATRATTKGGVIADREFQLWIDWLTRDGQLRPGRAKAREFFSNELNPFVAGAAAQVPSPVLADE